MEAGFGDAHVTMHLSGQQSQILDLGEGAQGSHVPLFQVLIPHGPVSTPTLMHHQ